MDARRRRCSNANGQSQREGRLQELVARLLTAQEAERQHIAADLHDSLVQLVTATQQHLEVYGYQVLEAGSGEEALALCQDLLESVALLLTDVVMPGMNGVELARRGAELRPDMRVRFMSGHPGEVAVRQGS